MVAAFRPRTPVDLAAYVLPLVVGTVLWWAIVRETGASEAWDEDVYWPVTFGALFVLGILLGGAGVPYVPDPDMPLVGLLAAALLFGSHIPSVMVTSTATGVPLLPVAIVVFLPLEVAFGGLVATAGVCLHRGVRALARRVF